MVIIIIFLFTNISMWAAIAFAYSMNSIHHEPYLMGIRIPREHRESSQVQAILTQYKARYRKITGIGFLSGVLMLIFNEYMSIMIPLMIIWFIGLMWSYQKNVMDNARRMYEVKRRNGWLVGETHVVRIDTSLSQLRDNKSVSVFWWIPSAAAAVFSGFLGWKYLQPYSLIFLISIGAAYVCIFLVYMGIRYAKPQVYCEESEINVKINGTLKFEWTKCFVIQGYFLAFLGIYLAFPDGLVKLGPDGTISTIAALTVSFLLAAGTFLIIMMAYANVKKVKDALFSYLDEKGEEIYGDDDEYWLNGYQNGGKRPKGLTEKRIGVGFTFQSMSGYLEKGTFIVVILVTFGLALFMMPFDFAQVTLRMKDGECRIEAGSMGTTFELKDVEQVTFLEESPSMRKKYGYDSNNMLMGDFRVDGYGICKVYVSQRNESVIKVDTQDEIIWFNSESETVTRQFYQQLMDELVQQ